MKEATICLERRKLASVSRKSNVFFKSSNRHGLLPSQPPASVSEHTKKHSSAPATYQRVTFLLRSPAAYGCRHFVLVSLTWCPVHVTEELKSKGNLEQSRYQDRIVSAKE